MVSLTFSFLNGQINKIQSKGDFNEKAYKNISLVVAFSADAIFLIKRFISSSDSIIIDEPITIDLSN